MTNFLLNSINRYYKEMMSLEGKIFVLDDFVKNFRDHLPKDVKQERQLMGYISTFRDLSNFTKGRNLNDTGYGYTLLTSTLETEIEIILSKEYCSTLSQAYEIFETYLTELFTDLLHTKPEQIVELKLSEINNNLPKNLLREFIKDKIGRQKNNRKYINIIRKLSPHFAEHEIKNIYKVNISAWFDLVSELRHNIVHNRQVISAKLNDFLQDNERLKLFKKYFGRKSTYDGEVIFLTNETFYININLLNEFAYFIFKSLSLANNIDPRYSCIK